MVRGGRRVEHRVIGRPADARITNNNEQITQQMPVQRQNPQRAIPIIEERKVPGNHNILQSMSNNRSNYPNIGLPSNSHVSNASPFPNPSRHGSIRPPSNDSRRSDLSNIVNSGMNIMQTGLNNGSDFRSTQMNFDIGNSPYREDRLLHRLRDDQQYNHRQFMNFLGDESDEEESKEQRFDFDLQRELEDLLLPELHFNGNLSNFRTNNRANQLRIQSNNNRIQQSIMNRNGQQTNNQSNSGPQQLRSQIRNQRLMGANNRAIPIPEEMPVRLNHMRNGLQNLRRRLDEYDAILNEIDDFNNETDNIVSNIEQIDRLLNIEAKPEEKKGITESGLKKQKKYKYLKEDKEPNTCSICLKNVAKGDQIYELVCKHLFHQDCIKPWFDQSHQCPNCRKDLN